jgi:hypothetical protein
MISALFGLAGVLIGGALNLLVGLRLAQRRDRRELRTAARLLLPELEEIRRAFTVPSRPTRWGALSDFPTERWVANETQLAHSLADEQWSDLQSVYTSLALFVDEASDHDADDELYSDDHAHIDLTLAVLNGAITSVASIAAGRRRSGRSEDEGRVLYEQSLREAELRFESEGRAA